jgi:hypothetical protein
MLIPISGSYTFSRIASRTPSAVAAVIPALRGIALWSEDLHQEVAIDYAYPVGLYGFESRQRECRSRTNIEASAVARADDLVALEFALAQRSAIVRADILKSVVLSAQIHDYDKYTIHLNDPLITGPDLVGARDSN